MDTGNDQDESWRKILEGAKLRPAMHIGYLVSAHRHALHEPLRLVWEAKAFQKPRASSVLLSPNQFIVRCCTGPLVQPIQKMVTWENKRVLWDGWTEAINEVKTEWAARILQNRPRLRGWRSYFGRPIGPTLASPMYPLVLARQFIAGYRMKDGLYCQIFDHGWPTTAPFLLKEPSPVGLMIGAELDREWFTGLPFVEQDAKRLSHWPNITIDWHETDDLFSTESLSPVDITHFL